MPRHTEFKFDPHKERTRTEHHLEEYEAGLDRVGPQFDREEDEKDNDEAMLRAAGATAYYPTGDEC